jgi:DNA-binding CsgD family transcriptional regulator
MQTPTFPLPWSPVPAGQPLVGRAAELAVLEQVLERTGHGAGSVLLVEGEAGIGKSRLVFEALEQARRRGFEVWLGAAEELDRRRPFALLTAAFGISRHAVDPARVEINWLLVGAVDSALVEFRVSEALLALIEEACARAPVVLGVEDLHWADPASLSTLWRLGRQVPQLPLLVVGSYRPTPRSPELARLIATLGAHGTQLALGPLPPQSVLELAGSLLGAELAPNLARQVAGAAGNPLFVQELLDALVTENRIILDEQGRADVAVHSLPSSLAATILGRLSDLPPETLHVLQVASVLGPSFALAELVLLSGRSTSELLAGLRPALAAGVLQEAGPQLAFRHQLLRDALYEDLPQAVRLGLHADLARALAAARAPATRVAEHFVRGDSPGDREAVIWLRRAAQDAAPRAPAVAAELLERALALIDAHDPERDQLLAERAESLLWSGRPTQTEVICRERLAKESDPATEAVLRQLLMSCLFSQSRNAEAQQQAELAAHAPTTPAEQRAIFVASGSWGRLMLGDLEGAAREAAYALPLAEQSGDSRAICTALQTLVVRARLCGRFREGLGHADRAIQAADQSPDRTGHRLPLHLWLGLLLMDLDQFQEGQQAQATGRQLAEELGAIWNLPNYHFAAGSGHWWAGAWDDAAAEYQAGLELAEELSGGWRLGGYGMLALIALCRDDLAGAEELLATAEAYLARTGPQPQLHLVRWPRALVLEARGQPEGALRVLAETWDTSATIGAHGVCPVLGPDLVRLALALGDRVRAEAVSATAEELARVNGSAGLRGVAELCRGLVTDRSELLVAAAESFGQSGRPFQRARACELGGRAVGAAGRVDEARGLLEAALELHEGLQATREAARVQAALRGVGVRRGRRGTRRRPKLGWASLTETERRVTDLVAEGLSNPQIAERMFLSRRTVQTHVSHVLAKLELNSRVELAAAAARRGS